MKRWKLFRCIIASIIIISFMLGALTMGSNDNGIYAQADGANKPPVAAKPADPMDQYRTALITVDSVIANIVLINTPQGQRGLTRGDVDELRRCTILLNTALAELEVAKATQPATAPEVPAKAE